MKNIEKNSKNDKNYAIFTAKLEIGGEKTPPEWVKAVPLGEFRNQLTGKMQKITAEHLGEIERNFADDPRGETVFDYEHQTLFGGQAPAAGWIKRFENRGESGGFTKVEWNEQAAGFIARREYKYVSPVIFFNHINERGERIGAYLHSVALTNTPWIRELPALVAKLDLNLYSGGSEMNEILKKLAEALGMVGETDEAKIIARVQTLKAERDDMFAARQSVMTKLGISDAGLLIASIDKALVHEGFVAKSMYDEADAERKTLKNEIAQVKATEVGGLVAKALTEGKIAPSQKAWAVDYAQKDRAGFEAFVASAAKVIPTGKIDNGAPAGGKIELSAEETAVCKQLGLDTETYRKYNPVK